MKKEVVMICAVSQNNIIGTNGNSLPWDINEDMVYFKSVTTNGTVVMGYTTFESLGKKPLPNRNNYVLSSKDQEPVDGVTFIKEPIIPDCEDDGIVWIIGGPKTFEAYKDLIEGASVTTIARDYDEDSGVKFDVTQFLTQAGFNLEESEIFVEANAIDRKDNTPVSIEVRCYQRNIG